MDCWHPIRVGGGRVGQFLESLHATEYVLVEWATFLESKLA